MIERSIVTKSGFWRSQPWRRLLQFAGLGLVVALASDLALGQNDSWRRTAVGWERTEAWNQLTKPPIGRLQPLTVGTLFQRTWPATVALAEVFLILAVLQPPAKQTD